MLALPSFYALGGLDISNLSNSPPEVNIAPNRQKYIKRNYDTP
nr:MAG TPA: hypothetical protein [Caudoviricetes sp.]